MNTDFNDVKTVNWKTVNKIKVENLQENVLY